MVSIWLTKVKTRHQGGCKKKIGLRIGRPTESDIWNERLLAILLDAGGAQARETMLVDRELPGKKFVDRQRVAAASFLEGKKAAADCGNDFGFTADDPP